MEYPSAKHMYNHMVGRTASVIFPFYSLLPEVNTPTILIKPQDGQHTCRESNDFYKVAFDTSFLCMMRLLLLKIYSLTLIYTYYILHI